MWLWAWQSWVARCVSCSGRRHRRSVVEGHMYLRPLRSDALLRGDGREGRPALSDLVTAAVRTGSFIRVMLCDGQNLQECFPAGVADELIVGKQTSPVPEWQYLDSRSVYP